MMKDDPISGSTEDPTAAANPSSSLAKETNKNVNKIIAIERAQKRNRTLAERFAERVAHFFGSVPFVWIHVAWFVIWISVNTLVPALQFDPYPFTFLTLVVSLEAIFLSTFILISQNHETRLTERRNHLDLQINMLAEQENTKMIEILRLIAERVGVPYESLELDTFQEEMKPEKLVEQIVSATTTPEERVSRIIKP
jgi:uncharacterized membrane protein